eukprot:4427930-Amphidinium_carterae.3
MELNRHALRVNLEYPGAERPARSAPPLAGALRATTARHRTKQSEKTRPARVSQGSREPNALRVRPPLPAGALRATTARHRHKHALHVDHYNFHAHTRRHVRAHTHAHAH